MEFSLDHFNYYKMHFKVAMVVESYERFFFHFTQVGTLMKSPTLNCDCPRWAIAYLHKCCYNWQPKKCLVLDVVNLLIFIAINGKKILRNHQKNVCFVSLFEGNSPSCELFLQIKRWSWVFFLFLEISCNLMIIFQKMRFMKNWWFLKICSPFYEIIIIKLAPLATCSNTFVKLLKTT